MKNLFIISLLILLTQTSYAGVHLEPYVGYAVSAGTEQTNNGTKIESTMNYFELGGRAGWEMMGLSFGFDGNFTPTSYDIDIEKPTKASGTVDYKSHNLGAFISFELPLLRVWGTYYFASQLSYDKDRDTSVSDSTGDSLNGSGYGVGVGFTALPMLAINLEYRANSYDEYKDKSSGVTTKYPAGGASSVDAHSILLSVSVPFHF